MAAIRSKQNRNRAGALITKDHSAAGCLPADPASVEESAAAEKQDHDEDDEERVGVHALDGGRRRPTPSVQLRTPGAAAQGGPLLVPQRHQWVDGCRVARGHVGG
jgi:hypothetical protein